MSAVVNFFTLFLSFFPPRCLLVKPLLTLLKLLLLVGKLVETIDNFDDVTVVMGCTWAGTGGGGIMLLIAAAGGRFLFVLERFCALLLTAF
jgi:hypothetical protein